MYKFVCLLKCENRTGILWNICNDISKSGGDILELKEYVTDDWFFCRVEWIQPTSKTYLISFNLGEILSLTYKKDEKNIIILHSKDTFCKDNILYHMEIGDIKYQNLFCMDNIFTENSILNFLKDNDLDLIILARYMKILSPKFVKKYGHKTINVHHSFLPAFVGYNAHEQAYKRGVKLIGATAHYITENLDEDPIICQKTINIDHTDNVEDIKNKSRELERDILIEAIKLHLDDRIIINGNKTIILK